MTPTYFTPDDITVLNLAQREKLAAQFPGIYCGVARAILGKHSDRVRSKAGHVRRVLLGESSSAPMLRAICSWINAQQVSRAKTLKRLRAA